MFVKDFLNFFYEKSADDKKSMKKTNRQNCPHPVRMVLLGFSLTVRAATLIFISWCGSAISSTKEGKSGFIYNLVKS